MVEFKGDDDKSVSQEKRLRVHDICTRRHLPLLLTDNGYLEINRAIHNHSNAFPSLALPWQ